MIDIYFLQSIQLGLTWHVLEASMELAICNISLRCLARACGRLHTWCNDVWYVPEADYMHDPEVPMFKINTATCIDGQWGGGVGVWD